jgi:hypothetical protein
LAVATASKDYIRRRFTHCRTPSPIRGYDAARLARGMRQIRAFAKS